MVHDRSQHRARQGRPAHDPPTGPRPTRATVPVAVAAALADVPVATVTRLIDAGRLKTERIGRGLYVHLDALDALLAGGAS